MAETKQEKRTFKWGDREYLLDDLLEQHAKYENNYYDFARDRGQYDATALLGLRQAITDRINAVKAGQSFDGDGALDTDRVDNTRILTLKKGLFKKDKYVDQDNTEWAKYYLNQLIGRIKPYEKAATTDKGAWDINKYGLSAYLTGQGLNARDIFEKYDLRDKDNPEAARSFTQRREILKKHLAGYNNWLKGKGFDFSKNDNEWDDTFGTDLDKFVTDYDNLDNNALATLLRKFGAGDDYTTAFTSDRWDLSKSPEELDAESKKRKEEEEAKLKDLHMREALDYFHSLKRQSNAIYATPFNYSNYKFKEGVEANFADWYNDLNVSERSKYGTYLGRDSKAWGNAWNLLMNSLKLGQQYSDKNLGMLLQGTFETQPQQFRDLGDGNYLIMDSITDSGQGTVYNPNSGYMNTVFLGDIADRNEDIMNAYKNLAYKYANNKYNTNYENKRYLFKEGGEIPKHQYGNSVNYNWEKNDQALESRAKTNNITKDLQKARERYIDSDNKSVDNPDAGFTGAEIARLVSIGADITSMFLDPITGTAVGLGSTLTNFGADIADDGFQWEDVKNLGINVGFDLLGAIPLFGDAVGTGSKITRNLVKWAPRVMAGLATYQGVSNFDGMMNSWNKMTSKDSKMTVQDWRNIAQSIGLITGATRAIKNKAAQNQMKNKAKVNDVVGVNVRDKNTGEIKLLLVDGKTAETIRNHKGDAKKIQQTLSELEGYKDKFGENGTWEINTKSGGLQKPFGRTENADGSKSWELRGFRKDGRADVNDVYDFRQVPQGYGASVGYKIPGVSNKLNKWHQLLVYKLNGTPSTVDAKGALTSSEIDTKYTLLLKDLGVDRTINNLKAASAARKKQQELMQEKLTQEQSALDTAKRKVEGYSDEATLNTEKANLESSIAGMSNTGAMHDAYKQATSLQKTIDNLQRYRQRLYSERNKHTTAIEGKKQAATDDINLATADLGKQLKLLALAQKNFTKLEKTFKKKYPNTPKRKDPKYALYKKDLANLNTARGLLQGIQNAISGLNTRITNGNTTIITSDANLTKVRDAYNKKFAKNKSDLSLAQGKLNTAKPLAELYYNYTKTKSDLDAVNAKLNDYAQVAPIQQKVTNLENIINLQQTVHTKAYNDLLTLLNNLRTSHSLLGGRNLNWDMQTILNRYGITDAFKQGGSININKINKFLNYAKG